MWLFIILGILLVGFLAFEIYALIRDILKKRRDKAGKKKYNVPEDMEISDEDF